CIELRLTSHSFIIRRRDVVEKWCRCGGRGWLNLVPPSSESLFAVAVYLSADGVKLYVPSKSQTIPSAVHATSTRAWNPASRPVPSENVHSPRFVARSSVQRPTALLPSPASRTTLLSSKPTGIPI